jgi:hypothetical protein
MITLDQIVNSNLDMLKSQEAELLKSLSFVQKARQLFESQNGSGSPATRTRSRGRKAAEKPAVKKSAPVSAKPAASKPAAAKPAAAKKGKPAAGAGKETRLSKILAAMKQKNAPISSGDLIQTLFKAQKEDRNFPHFRQLVYTTLTQAFKRGIIKRKGEKLQLA